MQKLFIHIGTPKTGSTQIQKALSKNKEELKKEKITNIKPKKLHKLIHAIDDLPPKDLSDIKTRLHHICDKYPQNQAFVISHESLCGYSKTGLNPARFSDRIFQLTKKFNVKIILYIRRQDLFVESIYTQYIHEGDSYSFDEFISTIEFKMFDWLSIVDTFERNFGKENLIIRKYDKETLPNSKSLLKDFATIINSTTIKNESSLPAYNSGYNMEALQIALVCNQSFNEEEKAKLRLLLQRHNSKKPFDSYNYFSIDKRKEFLNKFENSNAIINSRFFNNECKTLFNENFSYTATQENLPLNKALALVTMRTLMAFDKYEYKQTKEKASFMDKAFFKTRNLFKKFLTI